jgi:hypothetical protein
MIFGMGVPARSTSAVAESHARVHDRLGRHTVEETDHLHHRQDSLTPISASSLLRALRRPIPLATVPSPVQRAPVASGVSEPSTIKSVLPNASHPSMPVTTVR